MSKYKSAIHIKPSREGSLHEWAGIPEDKPIPMAKKEEAAHSKDPRIAKKGQFAENAAGWSHYRKKG